MSKPNEGRRAFVVGLAGAAAAATIAPAALATQGDDPIFRRIEAHRTAEAAYAAACHEQSQREDSLIDEGIGLAPFVTMITGSRPIVAHSHQQIDAYAGSVSERVTAKAHVDLDKALGRKGEVLGNIENEVGDLYDVSRDALESLITSVPTTTPGLRAMVAYVTDLTDQLESYQVEALLTSIGDALQVPAAA